ncbi:MAG: hypothetical protein FWG59_01350 [Betaproteobacteria bacterium]|nr:hypothetical protein [Betaproteobacteria bacterium]
MSTANDSIFAIRGRLGDVQGNRWKDGDILRELGAAVTRALGIVKRCDLDYGKARFEIALAAGEDGFDLPGDFAGVVGLYRDRRRITLKSVEELETGHADPFAPVWAVDGLRGWLRPPGKRDATLILRYWRLPAPLKQPADPMPWGGVFDPALEEYARIRLANADEMDASQDLQLLKDLENSMLTLAISRNPARREMRGWLGW